jgi:TonB family protein
MVHAQSQSPVQPRTNAPVLESKLVTPSAAENSASSSGAIHPISNLVGPKLIHWSNIQEDQRQLDTPRFSESSVRVSMTVTEGGVPTELKIVDSQDPLLNRSVLDAVANYRFTPASLNSKPTAIPLVLTVRVVPQI